MHRDKWILVSEGEALEVQPLAAVGDVGRQGHLMVSDDDVAECRLRLVACQRLCSTGHRLFGVQQDFILLNILQGVQIPIDGISRRSRGNRLPP